LIATALAISITYACDASHEDAPESSAGHGGTGRSAAGSGGSDVRDAKPIAQDKFAHALAEATCNSIAPCCMQFSWGTDASCITNAETTINLQRPTTYDAATGGRCVLAFARVLAKCALKPDDLETLRRACALEVEPAPPDTALCGTCAEGLECVDFGKQMDASKGPAYFCVRKQSVALGELCYAHFEPGEVPEVRLVCEPAAELGCDAGQTNRCFARAQRGEACGNGCGEGLHCFFSDMTCAAQAKDGEPCRADDFVACEFGSYCDPNAPTCKALPGFGEPCRNGACGSNLICENRSCVDERTSGQSSCFGVTTLWNMLQDSASR
jgi:hypothetical protein